MIEDWIADNIDSDIKYTGNGKEVHVNCPICGDSRYRLYINLNNGLVHCHNCKFSGNVINLIQQVEGISYTKAMTLFSSIKGNLSMPDKVDESIEHKLFMSGALRKGLTKRAIPLPEEYKKLSGSNNIVAVRARKYLKKRMVTNKMIKQYDIGFCTSGEYANRIIIPIKEAGELKFWVARAIGNTTRLKEKSPSNEDYQISKSEVIFNIDKAARQYHSAVISEGIFDALAWGGIGVSLLGKELYDEQMNILLDYRELLSDGLYIAIDWDARKQATEMAERLSNYFDVKIVNIPRKYDDPNKFRQTHSYKDMLKLLEEAESYGEFSSIRRRFT